MRRANQGQALRVAAKAAASLDSPCARRLRELAVGTEECSRRGSNQRIGPLRLQIQTAGFGWWRLTGRHGQFCLGPADRRQALRLRGLTATHMAESFA